MPLFPGHETGLFTVSELTAELKRFVSGRFRDIRVEGEVSNAKLYPSGHFYFTLKDDLAMVRGVFFNYTARMSAGKVVKDGDRVICAGRIDIYEKRGEYQLIASNILPMGDRGLLYARFLELKEKLFKEGLFDDSLKKPLPPFPRCVGIVTSPAGAAVRDMLRIIRGKYPDMPVQIYPSAVQGEEALFEIVAGIEHFNRAGEVDVMIVGRGGGSYEDLAPFNEEIVARAIFASEIPVVSAVGHEVDFTISDLVADVRAPTPTAAAGLVVPDKEEVRGRISAMKDSIIQSMGGRLERAKYLLVREVMEFKDRKDFFTSQRIYIDDLASSLSHNLELYLKSIRARCDGLAQRVGDLNPVTILKRGYSITARADTGAVVTDAASVATGETLTITLHKGALDVSVTNKKT